jgi:ArsR family metal-binding transcriptional regulator
MPEMYPSPRPSDKQVKAMKCLCNEYHIPLPEIAKMTQGQVGKWIRETKERYEQKNRILAQISITQVITTYTDGRISIDTTKERLK